VLHKAYLGPLSPAFVDDFEYYAAAVMGALAGKAKLWLVRVWWGGFLERRGAALFGGGAAWGWGGGGGRIGFARGRGISRAWGPWRG
jgi:hypothetical protein